MDGALPTIGRAFASHELLQAGADLKTTISKAQS
jgi:hypothetical protein